MTDKHTPRPWFWNSYDSIWAGKGHDSERIASVSHLKYDGEGDEVYEHGDEIFGPRQAEARANARLIAAAPELLSACEEALITVTERCKIEGINPDASPTVLCLHAAIKAAKGDA